MLSVSQEDQTGRELVGGASKIDVSGAVKASLGMWEIKLRGLHVAYLSWICPRWTQKTVVFWSRMGVFSLVVPVCLTGLDVPGTLQALSGSWAMGLQGRVCSLPLLAMSLWTYQAGHSMYVVFIGKHFHRTGRYRR